MILEAVRDYPVTVLGPRGVLVEEGAKTGRLYVLKTGDLEVVRDGSVVAAMDAPGNYALSGFVDWGLAAVFLAGGIGGGFVGSFGATRLAQQRGLLNLMFAGLVVVVALYMLWRSAQALFGA